MQDDSDKNASRVWKAASHFSSHLKWVFLWVNNLKRCYCTVIINESF